MAILSYIDRFGVEAVLGRKTLSHGEIQRLLTAEKVVSAYRSMKKALNWVEWSQSNPKEAKLLEEAMRAN